MQSLKTFRAENQLKVVIRAGERIFEHAEQGEMI